MDVRVNSFRIPGRTMASERSKRGGERPMAHLRLNDGNERDILPFPFPVPERRKGDDPLLRISPAEIDATMDRMQRKLDELRRLADLSIGDHGPRAA
jgi:hypothetical protein